MIPTKEEALSELHTAEQLNPGPWARHSLNVGIAAGNENAVIRHGNDRVNIAVAQRASAAAAADVAGNDRDPLIDRGLQQDLDTFQFFIRVDAGCAETLGAAADGDHDRLDALKIFRLRDVLAFVFLAVK